MCKKNFKPEQTWINPPPQKPTVSMHFHEEKRLGMLTRWEENTED